MTVGAEFANVNVPAPGTRIQCACPAEPPYAAIAPSCCRHTSTPAAEGSDIDGEAVWGGAMLSSSIRGFAIYEPSARGVSARLPAGRRMVAWVVELRMCVALALHELLLALRLPRLSRIAVARSQFPAAVLQHLTDVPYVRQPQRLPVGRALRLRNRHSVHLPSPIGVNEPTLPD